ncbi:MAG: ABC transporter ATP-binding protein [Chloroflexota bacterium]
MPASSPAITVDHLVRRYGDRNVVDGLSFQVVRGEVFALLGPNGAGKTTTVEILEGYRAPTDGQVRVLGLDPLADARRLQPRIGVMLQDGGVAPSMRPLEALELFASFFANPADPRMLLRQVGLETVAKTRYRALSGGQKQRLSLGLALVGRPELIFLDEPTAGMDPQARRSTWEIVRGLKADGVTVLLTTHFMEEAEQLADRVAIVDRGRLVALDAPSALGQAGGPPQEMRFRAPPGLPVTELVAQMRHLSVQELRPGEYLVEGTITPVQVAAVTGWLAKHDALLAELRVGRQSLEDVFLRLTANGSDDVAVADGPQPAGVGRHG